MDLASIRKLPKSVQSLICASNCINSYTKAVQELVFNALDADATSIAVRINIAEGSIQVVDNGCGIPQADFKYIGQNYMSSKLVDISSLKSAPNKYGFQGQSLANLAQISESLKVTSRFYKCETTCVKIFENRKAKSIAKCNSRPSKGTTIEIKGFFYNLDIQKKSVDFLSELQSIKTFLEHISLVHTNISVSLRDDSKNEILYKIHKNRDIYQTLYTLYEIEKTSVQELQVEKNQYKVKAYLGKRDVETNKHLIFLNGKFISDSSLLRKKLNENFINHLKLGKNRIKKDAVNYDESHIFRNQIPFYFIFITCPYMDYELTNTILEFKDWAQINIILNKLVKFYMGDIKLQEVPKNQITRFTSKHKSECTRDQIEKIIQKILGNHGKKPVISQMQNGIKGKLVKRKKNILRANTKKNKSIQKISKQYLNDILINEQNSNTKDSNPKLRFKPRNYKSNKDNTLVNACANTLIEKSTGDLSKKLKPKRKIAIQKRLHRNNDNEKIQQNYRQCLNKVSLNDKFVMETESVKRRCELLAQKNKKLIEKHKINPEVFINENVQVTRSKFINSNKNIAIHKNIQETIIHKYIPKSKFKVGKKIRNNQKNKIINTNYDLLHTIIIGNNELQECINAQNCFIPSITESDSIFIPDYKKTDRLSTPSIKIDGETIPSDHYRLPLDRKFQYPTPIQPETLDHNIIRESDNIPSFERVTPHVSLTSFGTELGSISLLPVEKPSNRMQVKETDDHNTFRGSITSEHNLRHWVRKPSFNSLLQSAKFDSNIMRSDEASPFQIQVTFQSHNYIEQDFLTDTNGELYNFCKKPSFITTRSRENFMNFPEINGIKTNKPNVYSKPFQSNNHKRTFNKSMKMFDIENNMFKGIQESYTIEFTESKEYTSLENNNNSRYDKLYSTSKVNCSGNEAIIPSMSNNFNDPRYQCVSPIKDPKNCFISKYNSMKDRELNNEPTNRNTFSITSSYNCHNMPVIENNNNETYTIKSNNKPCDTNEKSDMIIQSNSNASNYSNFVFVSKLGKNYDEIQITNPIDVCETVFENGESSISEAREFICLDSKQDLSNNKFNVSSQLNSSDANKMGDTLNEFNLTTNIVFPSNDIHEKNYPITQNVEELKETSHHFLISNSIISMKQSLTLNEKRGSNSKVQCYDKNIASNEQDTNEQNKSPNIAGEIVNEKNNTGAFNIKNRMCFVPKGMSPIFEKCQSKLACEYDLYEDYYADKIYNDFADKVQNDIEIYKPKIHDTNVLTTKDISKVNCKLNKDHVSLKFNGLCIKNAIVLGQVDSKFIAATMESHRPDDLEEFLVLFDQHAVHERIRLEKNLADYLTGSQWKSVTIDAVSLKMPRDNILYLHNYRDKFTQFGLQWDILNYNEISITAIPEGILGKNPRQVDKVIRAVKNLITEEINIIQTQGGCVSLYPKSLMDLVFSEACRYAIKFGDHLSKGRCIELLNGLSNCKTPFQCAHGRPVMAVIMNIDYKQTNYKINSKKLKRFRENVIGKST